MHKANSLKLPVTAAEAVDREFVYIDLGRTEKWENEKWKMEKWKMENGKNKKTKNGKMEK